MEKSSNGENIRVTNIKKIMEVEGIKHLNELADEIGMEPQNLHRIMKNGKVTERTCRRIIEKYPRYRIEFLLGYDDDMTAEEHLKNYIHNYVNTAEAWIQVVKSTADNVCNKAKIRREPIPSDDFYKISTRLKEYAELIVSEYILHRDTSMYWTRIDSEKAERRAKK